MYLNIKRNIYDKPTAKLSNPLAFEIQVQMRVTPKSNKHFPGCP